MIKSENNNELTSVLHLPFFFIIGAPRSGSSWLHQLLGAHPELASTDATELAHFNAYLLPLQKEWEREKKNMAERNLKIGLPYIWSEEKFLQFQQYFTAMVYEAILERNPTALGIVDRHAGYSYNLGMIKKLIPNAKFIHLIRDGREVVLSAISAHQRKGFGTGDIYSSSKAWGSYVDAAKKAVGYGQSNYFELRYEMLLQDPEQTLSSLFQFCQINANPLIIEQICIRYFDQPLSHPNPERKDYKTPLWEDKMSFWQKIVFTKISGTTMLELNYLKNYKWHCSTWFHKFLSFILTPLVELYYWPRHGLKPLLRKLLRTEKL